MSTFQVVGLVTVAILGISLLVVQFATGVAPYPSHEHERQEALTLLSLANLPDRPRIEGVGRFF